MQAAGLDAGSESVQNGINALTVADGALSSVTDLLQRMRSLVVEGRSDLVSDADRSNLNDELTALVGEIDAIAGKTSFNGLNLLNGSATPIASTTAQQLVVAANGTLASGLPLIDPLSLSVQLGSPNVDLEVEVDGPDANGNLDLNYTVADPENDLTVLDASGNPTSQPETVTIAPGTNYDVQFQPLIALGILTPSDVDQIEVDTTAMTATAVFTPNNITTADVGQTAFIYTANATQTNEPLTVAIGDHEGDTVQISLPTISANSLNVSDVALTDSDISNEGCEYRIDAAIQTIVGARAQLGAQMTSLQETQGEANTEATALQASESTIRDLDVAAASTTYVSQQIQVELGSRLMASINQQQTQLYQLLSYAI